MRGTAIWLIAAAVLGGVGGSACRSKGLKTACVEDADCGDPGVFRCDQGVCLCRGNAACAASEVCNAAGFCQARGGCYSNLDCPSTHICDTGSRTCVDPGRCSSDLQCPLGQLCDLAGHRCKAMCKSHSDCPFGQVCECGGKACNCPAQDAAGRAQCPSGLCGSDFCGDTSFCPYGQVCSPLPSDPQGLPACHSEYDPVFRPYCDNCVATPGSENCGTGANFCLINTYAAGSTYCGVDCSLGQSCLNGYTCENVIRVFSRWQCQGDADCGKPGVRSTKPCDTDADCARNNGFCSGPPGAKTCQARCMIKEGAQFGFCGCLFDEDCPQDSCDSTTHACAMSRQPCSPSVGCPTRVTCAPFLTASGCVIGKNCKPRKGLSCADVK